MAELTPRRQVKVRLTRQFIASIIDVPDDVRVARLVPAFDPGSMDLILESDRFAEVPEDAETPYENGLRGAAIEVDGKTYWRLEVDFPPVEHARDDHAYWAAVCLCGMSEQERTGHYPEHEEWCEVPSPLDDDDEVDV